MNHLQKRRLLIAFITLWLSIFIVGILQGIEKSHSSGFFYNSNNLPPRIHQVCQDNFIGTDWDKSRKYEKRCRGLWTEWTKEILFANK